MTYGVYTRDLKYVSLSERPSIDIAKKWCYDNEHVVCFEKKIWCGWSITFRFHKWKGIRIRPSWDEWRFGFVSIETKTHRYTWADKIVYNFRKQIDNNILIKEYNWENGHHLCFKYCRVAGHAALDFFTCFMWEIVGTPMELAFIATYDNYSYYVIFENGKIIKIFDSTQYNILDVEKWIKENKGK